jgi:hypothetical protein
MTHKVICQYPEFGTICGLPLPSESLRQIQRYPGLPLLPVCIRHYILHEWLQQRDRDIDEASKILKDGSSDTLEEQTHCSLQNI